MIDFKDLPQDKIYFQDEDVVIYCADCRDILPQISDKSIDFVLTSPPYNLGINYGICKDNLDWDNYFQWCKDWLVGIFSVLKLDGRFCLNHYLSFGNSKERQSPLMRLNELALKIGYKHHSIAIWEDRTVIKRTAWGSWKSASAPYINSPYEGILILFKELWHKQRIGISDISSKDFQMGVSGVWKLPTAKSNFPSAFSEALANLCIQLFSYQGDLILDPFLGSGTTAVACKELNRHFIGIEISPEYCKIAERRLLNTTGNLF